MGVRERSLASLKPKIVVASKEMGNYLTFLNLAEKLGMDCQIILSPLDLGFELQQGLTFLVFVEDGIMAKSSDVINLGHGRMCYWLMMAEDESTSKVSRFYSEGYSDVIQGTPHETVIRSRVLVYMERWLQRNKFPAGTILSDALMNVLGGEPSDYVEEGTEFNGEDFISRVTFEKSAIAPIQQSRILDAAKAWSETVEEGFSVVSQDEAQEKYLGELDQSSTSFTLWTRGQTNIMSSKIHFIDERRSLVRAEYPSKFNSKVAFARFLSEQAKLNIFCNFNIGRGRFFFALKGADLKFREDAYEFVVPSQLFRVQRREELRMPSGLGANVKCHAKIGDRLIDLHVLDFGAGGLRVLTEMDLIRHLRLRSETVDIILNYDSHEVAVKAQMKWLRKEQCGFEFMNLPKDHVEKIRLLCFESLFDYLETYQVA